MSFFDRLVRTVDLMPRLAQRLGINWQSRIDRDPYGAAEYRDALMRCAQCPHDAACRQWVERLIETDQPPDYCKNRALLLRLSAETQSETKAASALQD
ncbi:DUF6455 family protein [Thalassobius sp. Cn5-15]|jgi:hypothetical protein|uniref:DUF6455 family protein n=1 Tax=Thalassobius sp. Cn5-15 TaxID=2917763 RepID=UPI001EF3BC06|nr:DUF6455 family protein [Thalassobius sp. Cn5-15]MCG7493736.1 DUF6455 family protein [Thalassobius sp. Cn5-15]